MVIAGRNSGCDKCRLGLVSVEIVEVGARRCETDLREEALLVKEGEDAGATRWARLEQIHAVLVVLKVHVRPVDALALVCLLLHLEQMPAASQSTIPSQRRIFHLRTRAQSSP